MAGQNTIQAAVFDAYGTVFDVHSVVELAERFFPGKDKDLSQMWRSKQIEYMYLRTLMGRYIPHNENTESALVYCCRQLGIACNAERRQELMAAYLHLKAAQHGHRAPLRARAGAGQPGQGQHQNPPQNSQLEPRFPPPGAPDPRPLPVAVKSVHPDSVP